MTANTDNKQVVIVSKDDPNTITAATPYLYPRVQSSWMTQFRGGVFPGSTHLVLITEEMMNKMGVYTRGASDKAYREYEQVVHEMAHSIDVICNLQTSQHVRANGSAEWFAGITQGWFNSLHSDGAGYHRGRHVVDDKNYLVTVFNELNTWQPPRNLRGDDPTTLPPCAASSILYVDAGKATTGDGNSWNTAFKTLEEALALAHTCNVSEIRVAGGTYYPGNTHGSTDPRDATFAIMRSKLRITGGYNPATATDSTIIDGFIITQGNANGSDPLNINGTPFYQNNGGGIHINNVSSNSVIRNCFIVENNGNDGGGFSIHNATPTVINTVIANNVASYGGGTLLYNAAATFINCTVSGNQGNEAGFSNLVPATPATLINVIEWGNASNLSSSGYNVTYSTIQGSAVYAGTGNANSNPNFVNNGNAKGADNIWGTADDGLILQVGSPAINTGNNTVSLGTTMDVSGKTRIQNSTIDKGAYEYQASPVIPALPTANDPQIFCGAAAVGDLAATGTNLQCENAFHIVICAGEMGTAVLDGFTITGGAADTTANRNVAVNGKQISSQRGGGIYLIDASPRLSNLIIEHNIAGAEGGGINVASSSAVLQNVSVNTNRGGAIMIRNGANTHHMRADRLTVRGNYGGIGGIGLIVGTVTLANSLIVKNAAPTNSGALSVSVGAYVLMNTTISDNRSGTGNVNVVYAISNSSLTIINSIINNSVTLQSGSTAQRHNSLVQSFTGVNTNNGTNTNNIPGNTNPLFVDSAANNYRLQDCSPLINAGDNSLVPDSLQYDHAGNNRWYRNGRVDIGAFEKSTHILPDAILNDSTSNTQVQSSNGTQEYFGSCNQILASVTGDGSSSAVSGNVKVTVWLSNRQLVDHVRRYYQIMPAVNAGAATGRVTLYYTQADFDAFNNVNSRKLPQHPSDNAGKANLIVEKISGTSDDNSGKPGSYHDFGTTGSDARFLVVPSGKPYAANGTNSTLFTAQLSKNVSGYADIIGFGATTTTASLVNANVPVYTRLGDKVVIYPYTSSATLPAVVANKLYLNDVSFTVASAGIKYGQNGQTVTIASTVTAGNVQHASGSILGSQPETRNGFIGEVIAYERDLSEAEKQRVRSYVAIKYGITLPHNYIASNGTTEFWNITTNTGYNNNIAGIARDDDGSLYQKQSKSIENVNNVLVGLGPFATSNAANAATLSNGQSVLWGDNGLAKSLSIPFTGVPAQNLRFAAIWKVQNTGTAPGGVTNNLSYWYRADKLVEATGVGADVTAWTDFTSGVTSAQLGDNTDLPVLAQGSSTYFNYNPGINFTAVTQGLGNINVQTVTSLNYDIFTLTKEGLAPGGNGRVFSSLVMVVIMPDLQAI
ncbi:hypothetical protein OSTOST_10814 [Ostertagia ostertagi]